MTFEIAHFSLPFKSFHFLKHLGCGKKLVNLYYSPVTSLNSTIGSTAVLLMSTLKVILPTDRPTTCSSYRKWQDTCTNVYITCKNNVLKKLLGSLSVPALDIWPCRIVDLDLVFAIKCIMLCPPFLIHLEKNTEQMLVCSYTEAFLYN